MKITKANIGRLVCQPNQAETAFSDDEVDGLVLRARASGSRAWYFRYRDANGRSRRLKLGDAKAVAPDAARELARIAAIEVAGGNNPTERRREARHAQTCEELFNRYLAHAEVVQRSTTFDGAKRHLKRNAASLAKEPIISINRARVRALRDKLVETVGQVQTNRTLATISACWSWGLRNGVIPEGDNPASYIDKFPEHARTRVLTMGELAAIWKETSGGGKHDRLVRFLILTAARRAEGGGMQWAELRDDLWVVPAYRMKGGDAHEVALPSIALEQLPPRDNHPFVFGIDAPFSGWSGAKARLNKALGFSDWGLHDFRRTFSTEMNSRELAAPHIIEATLAHVGAKGGVAGVYNTASFRPQKKAALEAWITLLSNEGVV
jgi:integrase